MISSRLMEVVLRTYDLEIIGGSEVPDPVILSIPPL